MPELEKICTDELGWNGEKWQYEVFRSQAEANWIATNQPEIWQRMYAKLRPLYHAIRKITGYPR